ncbi:hypothetical protein KH141_10725, partial [butyrate-producing bacterium]|nr:hypothetical protein [butyrate-producing bacterium]
QSNNSCIYQRPFSFNFTRKGACSQFIYSCVFRALSLGIKDDMMEKYGEKLTNMCGGENTGWKSQKKINGR